MLFLTVLVGAPIAEMHKVVTSYSTMIGSSSQIQIWGLMGSASASTELSTLLLAIFGVAPLFGCLVFMFLPVVFTYMLSSFPAGLVIYWAWNNLLSCLQQWVIMRRAGAT